MKGIGGGDRCEQSPETVLRKSELALILNAAVGATFLGLLPALAGGDHDCEDPNFERHPDCGIHNMMLVGRNAAYLSHLPMFHSEHRFQVIFEANFVDGDGDVQQLYASDRKAHPEIGMYTVKPSHEFVLSRLFEEGSDSRRIAFLGTVHRGHLERESEEIDGLQNVEMRVSRVIYAREFTADEEKPAELCYIMFGDGDELFLAHQITQPPDFDQIVFVTTGDHRFTTEELRSGVFVSIPERRNSAETRLRTDESVDAIVHIVDSEQTLTLQLKVQAEPYFEEGELLEGPIFIEQTPLEIEAGF